AVIAVLPLLDPGDAGLDERWRLGLLGAHRLLADLRLNEVQRREIVQRQRDGQARLLQWDAAALGRVGARFRAERARLEQLLEAEPGGGHALDPGLELLHTRSSRIAPIAEALSRLDRAGRLSVPLATIASSLLHMHLNRLLRGDNVAQELVICDFLT